MLTEDQRMQMMYTGVTNDYIAERNLGRSTTHVLTIVNMATMPLLTAPQVSIELRYILCIVGIALGLFWHLINLRSRKRINYWQNRLAYMEPPEPHLLVFRVFTGSQSGPITKPPLFYAVNVLPVVFFFAWLVALFVMRFPKAAELLFQFFRAQGVIL